MIFRAFLRQRVWEIPLHRGELAADDALPPSGGPPSGGPCVVRQRSSCCTTQWCSQRGCSQWCSYKSWWEFCQTCQISPQEVKALLGSFYCRVCLPGPGEVIFDEHIQELEAGDSLFLSSINVYGARSPPPPPPPPNRFLKSTIISLDLQMLRKRLLSFMGKLWEGPVCRYRMMKCRSQVLEDTYSLCWNVRISGSWTYSGLHVWLLFVINNFTIILYSFSESYLHQNRKPSL